MTCKTLTLCVVCLSLLAACRSGKHNTENTITSDIVYVFDLENSIGVSNAADSVLLNDIIVGDLRFVTLETPADISIPAVDHQFAATENAFVISGGIMPYNIIQFDSEGKFVRELVRQGRGSGELMNIAYWNLNNTLDEVCVSCDYKFVVASLDGNKKQDIVPWEMSGLNTLPLNDETFVLSKIAGMGQSNEKTPYLTFVNAEGQVIHRLDYGASRNPDDYTYSISGRDVKPPYERYLLSSVYDGGVLFQDIFNDTIFYIKSSKEMFPHMVLKRGKYFPKAADANDAARKAGQIYLRNMMETEKYVFLRYFHDNRLYSDIWDKSTLKLVSRVETPTDFEWLARTFDMRYALPDGSEAVLNVAYSDKDKLYCLLEPAVARNFVEGITDDSNPTVMIATLR